MPKPKTFSFAGFSCEGQTLKEAKDNTMKTIERALTGDFTPQAIQYRNAVAFLWRNPGGGWSYEILEMEGVKPEHRWYPVGTSQAAKRELYGSSGGDGDQGKAKHYTALLSHLAQHQWDGEEETPDILTATNPQEISEFRHWARWQKDFKRLRAEGKTDNEAHHQASGH